MNAGNAHQFRPHNPTDCTTTCGYLWVYYPTRGFRCRDTFHATARVNQRVGKGRLSRSRKSVPPQRAGLGGVELLMGPRSSPFEEDGPSAGPGSTGETAEQKAREQKKGKPWTTDEHKRFLHGLQQLGKGDWRGISRQFVTSRTPSQVASHAQKYFLRQSTGGKRKRRASLFDMSMEENEGSKATAEMSNDGSANSISIASIYPSRTLHATKAQQRSPGEANASTEEVQPGSGAYVGTGEMAFCAATWAHTTKKEREHSVARDGGGAPTGLMPMTNEMSPSMAMAMATIQLHAQSAHHHPHCRKEQPAETAKLCRPRAEKAQSPEWADKVRDRLGGLRSPLGEGKDCGSRSGSPVPSSADGSRCTHDLSHGSDSLTD